MPSQEGNPGETQHPLKRLYLLAVEVALGRTIWISLLRLLPWQPVPSRKLDKMKIKELILF